MNRELIINSLLVQLTAAPAVFQFTADTTEGEVELANVSDATGLMVGMPVAGDGLAGDSQIATITPSVTVSLPAIADRSTSPMTQGFQTIMRRPTAPSEEFDMPMMVLVEPAELHPQRGDTEGNRVTLHCELSIYTRVGQDRNAIPAAVLNYLLDGIEKALYSELPRGMLQTLGLRGVIAVRIEGEVQKDAGHDGALAGVIIPINVYVAQHEDTYPLP